MLRQTFQKLLNAILIKWATCIICNDELTVNSKNNVWHHFVYGKYHTVSFSSITLK